jgi:hypothetical protein
MPKTAGGTYCRPRRVDERCSVDLFVMVRRLLVRFEAFGVMRHEDLALLHVPNPLDVGVAVEHFGRVVGQPDAGKNVLVQFSGR